MSTISTWPFEADPSWEALNVRAAKALGPKRWRPGMRTVDGLRVYWADDDGLFLSVHENEDFPDAQGSTDYLIPEMRDPATIGAFLAVVREVVVEVWDTPGYISTVYDEDEPGWCVRSSVGYGISYGGTEAEALIVALERAAVELANEEKAK